MRKQPEFRRLICVWMESRDPEAGLICVWIEELRARLSQGPDQSVESYTPGMRVA